MSEAPEVIRKLVARFRDNLDYYKSKACDEADIRQEFLNPFFAALGWDMENKEGLAPFRRDVVHEDRSRATGSSGTPDYAFRIEGKTKFFVEAKRASADLEHDQRWALQLRRYGWNAKLPVSILTDFEEFCVYDCRIPISHKDTAATARIPTLLMQFTDYVERWDEIAAIFSREAVLKGSFDKFAKGKHKKSATKQVDDKFLEDLEHWRELLAKEVHKNHPDLNADQLNLAVQLTIDRIVFLRLCEDRGIERIGQLQGLMAGGRIYPRLVEIFERADKKYNSGLFHFSEEKDREGCPDTLTRDLQIDDKVLKQILGTLYDDKSYSVYDFSIMPPEILGSVYERFLGSTIRLTPKQVKIEEKPEVRKAGGVYYTPRYIVDYIVKNTVGKLCEGKNAKSLSSVRVLDPSCGSGSFLLAALQFLYDVHLELYIDELEKTGVTPTSPPPEGKKRKKSDPPAIYKGKGDEWQLTTAEKRRILLNNIYGVDIDRQAVEVTKLSLLLTVLENENEGSLLGQLEGWAERALPDLGNNIKCGNSLIGPEFYKNEQVEMLDDAAERRINIFDWKQAFPLVFAGKDPGFDAVVGNPPYIRIQEMKEWAPLEVEFYKKRYRSARQGNYDIYVVFVERGLGLLNSDGRQGVICPNKFFRTDYGEELRKLLSEGNSVEQIVDFGAQQVFESATTYTCLLFLRRSNTPLLSHRTSSASPVALASSEAHIFGASTLSASAWSFEDDGTTRLINRMSEGTNRLLDLPAKMSRGSSTGDDKVFIVNNDAGIEADATKEAIFASDFGRYRFAPTGRWRVVFPYEKRQDAYCLLDEKRLACQYPKAYEYMRSNKAALSKRKQFKDWFGFSAARSLAEHERAQILVPLLADKGLCALIPQNRIGGLCLMAGGGFSITIDDTVFERPEYVLALLNSKLLFWRLQRMSNVFRGGWITCTKQYFGELPIRRIDVTNKNAVDSHNKIVAFVDRMIGFQRQLPAIRNEDEKERLERRIAATDQEIDNLVYELYGLTDEEIRIVEEATK